MTGIRTVSFVCIASLVLLRSESLFAQTFSAQITQGTVYEGQSWNGTLSISYNPANNSGIPYGAPGSYGINDFNTGTYSISGSASGGGTLSYFDPKPDSISPFGSPYSTSDLVQGLGVSFSSSTIFTQDSNGALFYGVNVSAGGNISVYRHTGNSSSWSYVGDQSYGVSNQPFQFAVVNVAPTVTQMQFGNSPGSMTSGTFHVNEGDSVLTRILATDPGSDQLLFRVDVNGISGPTLGFGDTTQAGSTRVSQLAQVQVFDGFRAAVRDDDEWSYYQPENLIIHNLDPIIDSWTLPTDVLAGELFSFSALAHDPGLDQLTFDWDFDGDGFYDDYSGAGGQYAFGSNGVWNVGLRVSDGDGGFAFDSLQVTVTPEPTSLALFGSGVLGLCGWRRRRKKR